MELQVKQLVLAMRQIAEEKNISEEAVVDVIEQALAAAYRKDFGDKDQEIRSTLNQADGTVTVYISKNVVEDVVSEDLEISLADAKKIDPNAEIDGIVEITDSPTSFGRVAAQTAKQVILQKLREAERETVLTEYQDKIGTVLNGIVNRVEARIVRIDLGKATGILPMSEQIPNEYYSAGARIKVFLKDVERTNRGPQLILSRAVAEFVEDLFRNEVPEMENGAVAINAIAREAGVRTKIAVSSTVPGVDPVGTFVGGHGTRVQAVMSEIGDNEKIDIITHDEDIAAFITNALSPTQVEQVTVNETEQRATVVVKEEQLSVAIGKNGQNVRLASKLTGYEIDITAQEKLETVTPKQTTTRLRRKSELESSLLEAIDAHGEEVTDADSAEESSDDSSEA